LILPAAEQYQRLMHVLRGRELIKSNIERMFQYILSELFSELYDRYPSMECLDFPSDEILDVLEIYDGNDRNMVIRYLKQYASEIQCLWVEYSLKNLMSLRLYLNCSIVSSGDLLLTQTPESTVRTYNVSI
jgi:hypothetical protein